MASSVINNKKNDAQNICDCTMLSSMLFCGLHLYNTHQKGRIMHRKSRLNKKRIWTIATWTLLLIVPATLAGCSTSHGSLRPSLEVSQIFETYKILPDHRYYYSGPPAKPNGIIGIHNSYTLNPGRWKTLDLTPEQLKNWISFMPDEISDLLRHKGALILDHTGKRVGVWYSHWDLTSVKIENDNQIVVYTPFTSQQPKKPLFLGPRQND